MEAKSSNTFKVKNMNYKKPDKTERILGFLIKETYNVPKPVNYKGLKKVNIYKIGSRKNAPIYISGMFRR